MIVQPTVGGLFKVIYRRKWSIGLVALIIAGLGAAYLITAIPVYRSDASLVVRFGHSAMPTTDLAHDTTPSVIDQNERHEVIQGHADILTSPDLAQAAIEKFGLKRLYPSIADHSPEIGTAMDAAVKRFAGDLFVGTELAGDVIRVAFTHQDPVIARNMLDTVIDVYMQRESEIFSGTSYGFQKTQADLALKHLNTAQSDLTNYKASTGVSDFDAQLGALIRQQSELSARLHTAQVSLVESTQKRDALTKLLADVPASVSDSSGDKYRQIDDSQSRVNTLRSQEREMIASHGPDWPALQALRASIAEANANTSSATASAGNRRETRTSEVHSSIQLDLLRASATAQSDQQAVALMIQQQQSVDKQVRDLEAVHGGLLDRQRDVALADSTYRSIAMHLEDSRIGNDRLRDGISSVALITQPNLPYEISKPRYRFTSLLIAAAALIGGLFVGFALEFFDDRLMTGEQVTARLNVPVLATFDKT